MESGKLYWIREDSMNCHCEPDTMSVHVYLLICLPPELMLLVADTANIDFRFEEVFNTFPTLSPGGTIRIGTTFTNLEGSSERAPLEFGTHRPDPGREHTRLCLHAAALGLINFSRFFESLDNLFISFLQGL